MTVLANASDCFELTAAGGDDNDDDNSSSDRRSDHSLVYVIRDGVKIGRVGSLLVVAVCFSQCVAELVLQHPT